MAYVELSNAYRAMVLTNDARPTEAMPKAREYALRAAELDPGLAEAQNVLAFVAFWYEFDPRKAEQFHLRALELDPASPQSRFGYAHLLSNTGRHAEALAEINRARELDPVNLVTNALEGQILFFAGDEDAAMKVLQATIEMDRNFWLPHLFISRIHSKKGNWDAAIAELTIARDLSNGNAEAIANLGYAQAKAGRTAEARKTIDELEARAAQRYVPSYALAAVYHGIGDREKTLDLLERAFAQKDSLMVFLKVEPKWDDLRSEPRFIELMKKMNFN
jgi:tetratricopeptide (TPR) repeat protein